MIHTITDLTIAFNESFELGYCYLGFICDLVLVIWRLIEVSCYSNAAESKVLVYAC